MGALTRMRDWLTNWTRQRVMSYPGFVQQFATEMLEKVPGLTLGATYEPDPIGNPGIFAPVIGANGETNGEIYLSNDMVPAGVWIWEGGTWNPISQATGGGYVLPTASALVLGGIKVGTGLTINGSGVLSNNNPTVYVLPTASAGTLGGIKVGTGLSIDGSGILSNNNPTVYVLPTASAVTLGGIKVGTTLTIAAGVLDYLLPTATASVLGGIKIGPGLTIASGIVNVNPTTADDDDLTQTALYREITGGTFPTAIVWWETAGKVNKVRETLITRNGDNSPATITYKYYKTGVLQQTITDTITYTGVVESSRARVYS